MKKEETKWRKFFHLTPDVAAIGYEQTDSELLHFRTELFQRPGSLLVHTFCGEENDTKVRIVCSRWNFRCIFLEYDDCNKRQDIFELFIVDFYKNNGIQNVVFGIVYLCCMSIKIIEIY